jgi:uncharacterized protein (TIGR00369 family)
MADQAATVQQMTDRFFPGLLGVRFLEATPERVRAELAVRDELCTVPGILHGGAIMSLADTLGAVGTFLNLPQGASTTTIESKTNFLGAVREGAVTARARPLHVGKTTIVVETDVYDAAGRRIARTTQTQAVLAAD